MGAPGTGQVGALDDLNAEEKYESMKVHMNTVAGNEALVQRRREALPRRGVLRAEPGPDKDQHPRQRARRPGKLPLHSGGVAHRLLHSQHEDYADLMVPLLLSPELDAHSGALFNARAQPIERSEG